MGGRAMHILVGKKERDHWEDHDVGGWKILK
jgi:hypothetical protein